MADHVVTVRGSRFDPVVLMTADGEEAFTFGVVPGEDAALKWKKTNKPTEEGLPASDNIRRELSTTTLEVALDGPEDLEQLIQLADAEVVLDVVAGMRSWPSMLIVSISPTMGQTFAISASVEFEELRTTQTRLVTLPETTRRGRTRKPPPSEEEESKTKETVEDEAFAPRTEAGVW